MRAQGMPGARCTRGERVLLSPVGRLSLPASTKLSMSGRTYINASAMLKQRIRVPVLSDTVTKACSLRLSNSRSMGIYVGATCFVPRKQHKMHCLLERPARVRLKAKSSNMAICGVIYRLREVRRR